MSEKYMIKRLDWTPEGEGYPRSADGVDGEYYIHRTGELWHVEIDLYAGDMEHIGTAKTLDEAKAIADKDNTERLLPYLEAVAWVHVETLEAKRDD